MEGLIFFLYGGFQGNESGNIVTSDYITYQLKSETPEVEFTCEPGYRVAADSNNHLFCSVCTKGFFNVNGDGVCHPCVEGAICNGGREILAQRGFWQDPALSESDPIFYECTGESCCESETGCSLAEMCTGNTTGPLCSVCLLADQSRWESDCFDCKEANAGYFTIFIVVVTLLVLILVFVYGGENHLLANLLFNYQV